MNMKEIRVDAKGNRLFKGEYERKDGRYEYRYTDIEGNSQRVYEYRLQQLRMEEARIAFREHTRILHGVKELSLNDMMELWIASKVDLKESTLNGYRRTYEIYVKNGLGKRMLEDITTADIKCFYNSLKISRSLSTETICRIQNVIFQIFRYAMESEVIGKNPATGSTKELKRNHSKHTSLRPALTESQAKILTDFIWNTEDLKRWYPVFYIFIHTGMRLGELTALRWCDVDLEKGFVQVNHSISYYQTKGDKGAFHITEGTKTVAGNRKIPIGKDVMQAFLLEKEFQRQNHTACAAEIDGYTDFVFLNRFGNVYSQRDLNRAITGIVEKYNANPKMDDKGNEILLPHLTCHCFRHTFAVILCERDVNVKVAQMLLGHKDISTTMDIYTRVSEEFMFKEYAEKVMGE